MASKRLKKPKPIVVAEDGFARAFGVWHQSEHIAAFVVDAGDVVDRAVWVVGDRTLATGVAVAKRDLSALLELRELSFVALIAAVSVCDGQAKHRSSGKRSERAFGLASDKHISAFEPQVRVACERSGQKAKLGEDLKAVADPEHGAALLGECAECPDDGAEPGDRPWSQIVAVRKTTGHDDGVGIAKALFLVKNVACVGAKDVAGRVQRVPVSVGTGETHDRYLHGGRSIRWLPEKATDLRGFRRATQLCKVSNVRGVAVVLAVVLATAAISESGRADGPLGADDSPIATSQYAIDLYRGPVIGTSRMVGLAGAFVAIAEGVEGGLQNPAAVANRQAQWPDWYDYWLAFSFTYPTKAGDFYNSGAALKEQDGVAAKSFFFVPGFSFQMWQGGLGLTIDTQVTTVTVANGAGERSTVRLGFPAYHVQAGYGFLDGQLIVGGGLRLLQERIKLGSQALGGGEVRYRALGVGGEVGVMIKRHAKRWRVGAALYPKLTTNLRQGGASRTPDGDLTLDGIFLPEKGVDPWRGSVGFSWQFGPRPPNPRWVEVEELAGADLAHIDERMQAVKARREREIEQARLEGGHDEEARIDEIRSHHQRVLAHLKKARKNLTYAAWKVLRERYRNEWPRRYLLLSAELSFAGRVSQGVGIESFAAQRVQRSGQNIGYSPRIGIEGEVWPKRMKMRTGAYLEPTRFRDVDARLHWTFGMDIRVLHWDVFGLWPEDYLWDIKVAFDLSEQYSAFSFGIGGFY